jgi:hypothetical protein
MTHEELKIGFQFICEYTVWEVQTEGINGYWGVICLSGSRAFCSFSTEEILEYCKIYTLIKN